MPTILKVNSWIDCGWCTWRLLDHLWDSESCRKEWERFWLLLAEGEGEKDRDRSVLLVMCSVWW